MLQNPKWAGQGSKFLQEESEELEQFYGGYEKEEKLWGRRFHIWPDKIMVHDAESAPSEQ